MKNKFVFLIVTMAGFLFSCSWAQTSVVHQTSDLAGKKSIVREWNSKCSVLFAMDGSSAGYFVLEDHATNMLTRARIPNNVQITDFRILHDSVFFCGFFPYSGPVSHVGVVGCFDIQQLFGGSGDIRYGVIPPYGLYYGLQITEPRRMDVYEDSCTHIVFVGATEVPAGAGLGPATTVCDACFDGTLWRFRYYVNKAEDRIYTDIAANNSYVVAVGTDTTRRHCVVDVFYAVSDIINHRMLTDELFYIDGANPISDVLVEDVAGERFAVAYQNQTREGYGTTLHVFDIDAINATLNVVSSVYVPHVPTGASVLGWSAKDLLYAGDGNLMFLQDTRLGTLGGVESVVGRFPVSPSGASTLDVYYEPSYQWNNIDRAATTYYSLSGTDAGSRLDIHHNQFPPMANCARHMPVRYEHMGLTVTRRTIHLDKATGPCIGFNYAPVIDNIPLFTNCTR